MRLRFPQPDKLPLKCLELRIGSRISCCASRTFACRVALNDRTHSIFRTTLIASIALLRTTLTATETAIIRMGLQSMAPGPHYLQLIGLTAAGPPATSDPVRPRYAMDRAGC